MKKKGGGLRLVEGGLASAEGCLSALRTAIEISKGYTACNCDYRLPMNVFQRAQLTIDELNNALNALELLKKKIYEGK